MRIDIYDQRRVIRIRQSPFRPLGHKQDVRVLQICTASLMSTVPTLWRFDCGDIFSHGERAIIECLGAVT
jgi:hypothetical protein